MNILIYRYNSICEPDVIDAFKELGHSVTEITEEMKRKDVTPKETVEILNRVLMAPDANYDLIFSINFYPAISEVCNILHIPYLSWTVDSPVLELYAKSITNEYNRTFLFDYGQYQELEPLNPGRIFHLPLATNVEAKDKVIKAASKSTLEKFKADVSFVGSLYSEKCPYDKAKKLPDEIRGFLDGVMNAQLQVYGYFFLEEVIKDEHVRKFKECMPDFYELPEGSYLTDRKTMAQFYMGNKVTAMERLANMKALSENFKVDLYTGSNTDMIPKVNNRGFADALNEMPIIFNQSKINLNMTSKAIRFGIPLRVWDVLGSGGFLISNFQTEIPKFLVPGEDLVTYGSKDELIDLTRYYLENDKERIEIAANAYEKVKEHHTFVVRIQQMLDICFGYTSSKEV